MSFGRICQQGWLDRNFAFVQKLATGGQAAVEVRRARTGKRNLVAVKVMYDGAPEAMRRQEFHILTEVLKWRPEILEIIDYFIESERTFLVTKYYTGGTLSHMITAYRQYGNERLQQAFIWHAASNLANAIKHIHGYGVVHRDIKPQNIFLDWPRDSQRDATYPNLVLGDFGIAEEIGAATYIENCPWGTAAWQPPERPRNGPKADVWAVGAVIHALCHQGQPPIRPPPSEVMGNPVAMKKWWESPRTREIRPLADKYSTKLESYVYKMLRWSPADRIDSQELAKQLQSSSKKILRKYFRPLCEFARSDLSLDSNNEISLESGSAAWQSTATTEALELGDKIFTSAVEKLTRVVPQIYAAESFQRGVAASTVQEPHVSVKKSGYEAVTSKQARASSHRLDNPKGPKTEKGIASIYYRLLAKNNR